MCDKNSVKYQESLKKKQLKRDKLNDLVIEVFKIRIGSDYLIKDVKKIKNQMITLMKEMKKHIKTNNKLSEMYFKEKTEEALKKRKEFYKDNRDRLLLIQKDQDKKRKNPPVKLNTIEKEILQLKLKIKRLNKEKILTISRIDSELNKLNSKLVNVKLMSVKA